MGLVVVVVGAGGVCCRGLKMAANGLRAARLAAASAFWAAVGDREGRGSEGQARDRCKFATL